MSRTHHLKNIQRQTKEQVKIGEEDHQNTGEGKDKNYSSYFYRDPPANNNISPSPSSSNANTIAISKSKDQKNMKATRLLTKNNNSNIYGSGKKYGEEQFLALKRQNKQLRNEIVELKVNQFYQFDNNKLKDLISDVQKLKEEVSRLKEQNELLKLENDFLNRANFQLKKQRQGFTQNPLEKKARNKQIQQTFCQNINLKTHSKTDKTKQILSTYQSQKNLKYPGFQNAKVFNTRSRQKDKLETDEELRTTNRRDKSSMKNMTKLSEQKLIHRYMNRKKLNSEGSEGEV